MYKLKIVLVTLVILSVSPLAFGQKKGKGLERPPAPVELSEVIEREINATINLVGTAQASRESVVSSEVEGRVIALNKKEGQHANAGETIIGLDPAPYKIALRVARAGLNKAEAQLEKAKLAAKRAEELFTKRVTSQELKQNTGLDVQVAMAEVSLRTAELAKAELDHSRCWVKAPYEGYFAKKLTDVGYWVKDGDGLFEIVDIHKIEVVVEAPERYIAGFSTGKKAEVRFDAYPGQRFEGAISAMSPKADLATRTFMVKIGLDNKNSLIKAGMLARVSFATTNKTKAKLIARDAVVWRARKALVFVVGAGAIAQSIQVTIGRQHGDMVEATGPIAPGDKLIVTGNEILRDGHKVNVVGEITYD